MYILVGFSKSKWTITRFKKKQSGYDSIFLRKRSYFLMTPPLRRVLFDFWMRNKQ